MAKYIIHKDTGFYLSYFLNKNQLVATLIDQKNDQKNDQKKIKKMIKKKIKKMIQVLIMINYGQSIN